MHVRSLTYNFPPDQLAFAEITQDEYAEAFTRLLRKRSQFRDCAVTVTFAPAEAESVQSASDDRGEIGDIPEEVDLIADEVNAAAFHECCLTDRGC